MQSRKICGFSGIVFSRMGVKESGLFSGRQTIWNALRVALGIFSGNIIFGILQIRQGCGPAGFAFSRERALREVASAAVGLRPKRSKSNAFYGNAPHRGVGAQRLRGVPIGGSRKYGEKIFTPNRRESSVFSGVAHFFRIVKGVQPLTRCGVGGVQR